jgi:hypothetical protein
MPQGLVVAGALLAWVLAVALAYVHHAAAQYDFETPGVIEDGVKEIRVAPPQTRGCCIVCDDKGPQGSRVRRL